ncbi:MULTISPECIES: hypothetical protein [unclassified Halomonas]|uniref:hypothetical protein n=1 Tax=unclassified Halomonas TaxID=2609666 RepID=UPI001CF5C2BC|nr:MULTISPECIES: hypothetical protein [unclassified Halomonas]MCA8866951.1 hypothetical protein [Halomonas sp. SBBP1]UZH09191.1 hypothetical protein OM794_17900 [Halomonas sp. BDJS001]
MRLLIAILLFLICAVFTSAASNGYASYEGLLVDIILTAILIPSVMALPFCLPKSGRNVRRFLKAYNIALLVVILFQVKDLPVGKEKAIASTEGANNSEMVSSEATNRITNGEFIISIPDTWTVYVPNGETYLARIESEVDKIEMYIGYDQNNTSLTHEEYTLSLERSFKSNMSGDIFVSKLANCGVKDVECRYKIFNVVDGDREITSVVASFSAPHGHYRVSMNTLTPLWEVNSEIFFEMIHSFRLL